jgi:metal-sulfur cluster biosynthetic enzyme
VSRIHSRAFMASRGATESISGSDALRVEVARRLNEIIDPCSRSFGTEIGIIDMGLVPQIEVTEERIVVGLCPTFPGCLFVPSLLRAIDEKLAELKPARTLVVRMAPDQLSWDPSQMSEAAKARLQRARATRERQTGVQERRPTRP